jgi:hypothetical protein
MDILNEIIFSSGRDAEWRVWPAGFLKRKESDDIDAKKETLNSLIQPHECREEEEFERTKRSCGMLLLVTLRRANEKDNTINTAADSGE